MSWTDLAVQPSFFLYYTVYSSCTVQFHNAQTNNNWINYLHFQDMVHVEDNFSSNLMNFMKIQNGKPRLVEIYSNSCEQLNAYPLGCLSCLVHLTVITYIDISLLINSYQWRIEDHSRACFWKKYKVGTPPSITVGNRPGKSWIRPLVPILKHDSLPFRLTVS